MTEMLRRSLPICLIALLVTTYGCVTRGPVTAAKSNRSTTTHSAKSSDPNLLFDTKDIRPEGNSVLHYIDSRLYGIRESDGPALEALQKSVDGDPNSPYLHAELSRSLAELNQFEQSTLEAEKALSLDPKSPKIHLLRGKLYSVKKDTDKAIAEYQNCLRLDPDQEECYTMLTREYILLKQYPQAIATIQKLLDRNPDSTQGLYYLGMLYSSYQKDQKKAVLAFKKLLDEDPEDLRGLASLAQLYLDDKKLNEALEILLKIEKIAPSDIPMKLRIGLIYYELKDYDQAIERFTTALQLSPDNERVSYYLGLLEAQRKNYEKALQYLKAVPSTSDLYGDSIIRIAMLLQEMKQDAKAIAYAKSILKDRQDIPELYEVLASFYSQKGDFKEAIRVLDQGLDKFPKQEKLLFSKGVIMDKMGEFDKSIEAMRSLIEVNPQNASALNYIAYSYAEKGIHLQEALEMSTQANKLRPDDGYIVDSLAWVYFKMGQRERAIELLKKANQLSPNEPTILEHLGDIYLERGETERARGFFREAVAAAVKQEHPESRDVEDLKRIQSKLSSLDQ